MEVKSLFVHNLGRFKELPVPLAPTDSNKSNITVFVGNNGTGKTSLLQVVQLLLNAMMHIKI